MPVQITVLVVGLGEGLIVVCHRICFPLFLFLNVPLHPFT